MQNNFHKKAFRCIRLLWREGCVCVKERGRGRETKRERERERERERDYIL